MINKNVQASDIKILLLKVYQNLKRGEITESQASRETFILSNILKTIEVTEIEERLIKLERVLNARD